jgi:hypothetical protein
MDPSQYADFHLYQGLGVLGLYILGGVLGALWLRARRKP